MIFEKELSDKILESLTPFEIDFYQIGLLKLINPQKNHRTGYKTIIRFKIEGDTAGDLLIGFERFPQDRNMSLEMANILASKFVSALNDYVGLWTDLSTPAYLEQFEPAHHHCELLLNSAQEQESLIRSYFYRSSSENFFVKLLYLPNPRGAA